MIADERPGNYQRSDARSPFSCEWFDYDEEEAIHLEAAVAKVDELRAQSTAKTQWLNIVGATNVDLLKALEEKYGLHPLALEDVSKGRSRPKVDEFADHIFVVMRQPATEQQILTEQVGIFLRDNLVVTIQQEEGDVFEDIRNRLNDPTSRIRLAGADYLAYSLIDAMVDAYFPVIDDVATKLAELELRILNSFEDGQRQEVHAFRSRLTEYKRVVSPIREVIHRLLRGDAIALEGSTRTFLKDAQDHVLMLLDSIEQAIVLTQSLRDLHDSEQNRQMNDVMKLLTVMSTIFMPLSFMVGLYGMNFDTASSLNMPELSSPIGYPLLLLAMLFMSAVILVGFYKIGWVTRKNPSSRP